MSGGLRGGGDFSPAHGGEKADRLALGKRDEKHAVGALREPLDEASFLHGGGYELRRLPQHERGFDEERSPKSDQLLGVALPRRDE